MGDASWPGAGLGFWMLRVVDIRGALSKLCASGGGGLIVGAGVRTELIPTHTVVRSEGLLDPMFSFSLDKARVFLQPTQILASPFFIGSPRNKKPRVKRM